MTLFWPNHLSKNLFPNRYERLRLQLIYLFQIQICSEHMCLAHTVQPIPGTT